MEKLKMESVSIAEDSLNKIAELFQNVVTESMGKDGQLHKAIDFDKLKFLLTANQAEMGVVYDDDERYELTWVGKKQAIREVAHPIRKTLRPCPEESRNWEQTQNLYIEGDNLDAMKLLKKTALMNCLDLTSEDAYKTDRSDLYFTSSLIDKKPLIFSINFSLR